MSNRKADERRLRFFRIFMFGSSKITPITHSFTPTETEERDEFEEALEQAIDESVEDAIREVEPSVGSFERVW